MRRVIGLMGVDERESEQGEARECSHDCELLVAGERTRVAVTGGECEHGDPGCADSLDERDRGEAQRGDVDEPAGRLGGKCGDPALVPEQQRDEAQRSPRREARHDRGCVVLTRVCPVDCDG